MTRALFTACDRHFLPGARALLSTAARYHPDVPRFCMVPAADVAEMTAQLGDLAAVLPPPRAVRGIPPNNETLGYRLFAPTLPFDRVAFIDADAIFCRPAPELWETAPGCWNAVEDGAQKIVHTIPKSLQPAYLRQFPGMAERKGFNCGVFALAPAEWPTLLEDYERTVLAGDYPAYTMLDQVILNAMLQGRVRWLPFAFNVHNLFDRNIPRDARIIHYAAGVCKPWDPRYPRHEPQYHYWLKYGLNETRAWPLLKSRLLVAAITPKRLLGRMLRQRRERRGEGRSRWDEAGQA